LRRFSLSVVSGAIVAALLAACSGGGTPSLPAGGTSAGSNSALPSSDTAAPQGDFHPISAFRAVGDANEPIAYFPPNDGLWIRTINGMTRTAAKTASGSGNLLYNGGPIQSSPKTYVVYWGSSWNSSSGDPDGMRNYYNSFLSKVGGSNWNGTVTQYYQTNPTLYTGNIAGNFGGSYVDTSSTPPSRPTQSQMAAEAKKAAAHFGNYSVNAQYIVAMPHGISPSGFKTQYCAYHATASTSNGTISWTNMPYIPDAGSGCGAKSVTGSVLDGVSIVGGHEMAESETDPHVNAWYDSSGEEIGDKCAWINLQDTNINGTDFPTQPLWSNAAHGCVQ
jgi:hypothetical protein